MQGIEKIAYQNACTVALKNAERTGEVHYVSRDEENQLMVGTEKPEDGNTIYIAKPDGLAV